LLLKNLHTQCKTEWSLLPKGLKLKTASTKSSLLITKFKMSGVCVPLALVGNITCGVKKLLLRQDINLQDIELAPEFFSTIFLTQFILGSLKSPTSKQFPGIKSF